MTQIASDWELHVTAVGDWGPCVTPAGAVCYTGGLGWGAVGWVNRWLRKRRTRLYIPVPI